VAGVGSFLWQAVSETRKPLILLHFLVTELSYGKNMENITLAHFLHARS